MMKKQQLTKPISNESTKKMMTMARKETMWNYSTPKKSGSASALSSTVVFVPTSMYTYLNVSISVIKPIHKSLLSLHILGL